MEYEFTIVLKGSPELTEELADQLFAAGCDDASPYSSCGVTAIVFHRDANSLEEAIRSAIANVNAAGCVVSRVEIEAESLSITQST